MNFPPSSRAVTLRWVNAFLFAVLVGLGAAQVPVSAQDARPYLSAPTSGLVAGDIATVSGANFVPGSVVMLKVTGPRADSWSQSVGIGPDGKMSFPILLNDAGVYSLEVIAGEGNPMTMLITVPSH
jgi:hypothetical protein